MLPQDYWTIPTVHITKYVKSKGPLMFTKCLSGLSEGEIPGNKLIV